MKTTITLLLMTVALSALEDSKVTITLPKCNYASMEATYTKEEYIAHPTLVNAFGRDDTGHIVYGWCGNVN